MRIERLILIGAWLLLGAGILALVTGGEHHLRGVGAWLLLGAVAVLSLPLLAWLIHLVLKRKGGT
jgi:membrane protein implicated in regulation of membrane protease activity